MLQRRFVYEITLEQVRLVLLVWVTTWHVELAMLVTGVTSSGRLVSSRVSGRLVSLFVKGPSLL